MSTTPRRLGKYELHERLGRGGMAEVWKAFDAQLRRYVAIKLLHANLQADPDFVARFTHEAQVIASLHHPNIVQIHDFHISQSSESDSTTAYMVMDYVEGQTLADYIHNTSRLGKFPPAADIVRLFTSISIAVDYAHLQGMIHRDIKPANILLDKRNTSRNLMGEPILSDFGIAKLLGTLPGTLTATSLGTPLYISPEQVQNRPISERTDIYSFGVVLYEMFTGVPPFRGSSPVAIMMQHLNDLPTVPSLINPHIPPALTLVLLQGLAKDPQARFPSASSMTTALAEALDIPVPEALNQVIYSTNAMNMPTYLIPRSNAPLEMMPSSPSLSGIASSPTPPMTPDAGTILNPLSFPGSTTQFMMQAEDAADPMVKNPSTPIPPFMELVQTPPGTVPPSAPAIASGTASPSLSSGTALPTPLLPLKPAPHKGWNRRFVLASLLILVLVGSSLGTLILLTHNSTVGTVATNPIAGHAFFVSSGQVNENNILGSNDEFEIALQNVPDPQPGKSYFAWLLSDESQNEAAAIFLGKVIANHGDVLFFYTGDTQHANLLDTTSRLLITEENANILPSTPSPDINTWRYAAELPQIRAPSQPYSMLDHLRHLLTNDPKLKAVSLPGGLNIWLFRNTEKILEWAGSARDDWETQEFSLMHRQIVRILDYLDGQSFVQKDVPPGTPMLANPHIAQVALLEFDTGTQNPPGYLYHIGLHLNGVLSAPGVTQYQRNLATQIHLAINNVQGRLEQVHRDAAQLVTMNDAQLALPSSLTILNDMATQANYAYVGRNDPSTDALQAGVAQIYFEMQQLATFDIKPYKP